MRRAHRLLVLFAMLSVVTALAALGGVTTTGPSAPAGSTPTCGATVANYAYSVPFGTSPWNTPTCTLPMFRNNPTLAAEYGRRLFMYGNAWNATTAYAQNEFANADTTPGLKGIAAQRGNFMTQFGLAGDQRDFGTPIYYATAATTGRKLVKLCGDVNCFPSNLAKDSCKGGAHPDPYGDLDCMAPNVSIPWDPSWRPSGSTDNYYGDDAGDREMVIVDTVNGRVYNLWRVNFPGNECLGRDLWYGLGGRSPEYRLCVGGADVLRDKAGAYGNYASYSQGVQRERGMGIHNAAMIVTPEEVAAGEIRHALTMEAFNTMFGPVCSATQLQTGDPNVLGRTCGYAVAPATHVEWGHERDTRRGGACNGIADQIADFYTKQTFGQLITLDKTVPEGMRFKLTMTDAQIDAWIASRPDLVADAKKARTARIFAVALRDYGWIVGDTTCYGAGFTVAGAANPDAKAKWAALGIKDSSSQFLLKGLFTESNIVALNPPTAECVADRTKAPLPSSTYACLWTSASYPLVTPPPPPPTDTTPPSVPAGVKATATSATKVTITWNASTDASGIAGYDIYRGATKVGSSTSTTYTDSSAAASSTYSYTVRARDTAGNVSAASAASSVTTPAPPPPTSTLTPPVFNAPLSESKWNPSINAVDSTITLSWKAATSSSGIKSYTLKRDTTTIYQGAGLLWSDYAASNGGAYTYSLTATDNAGATTAPVTVKASIRCGLFEVFFCGPA